MSDLKAIIQLVDDAFDSLSAQSWAAKYAMADAMLALGLHDNPPSSDELRAIAVQINEMAAKQGLTRATMKKWVMSWLDPRD